MLRRFRWVQNFFLKNNVEDIAADRPLRLSSKLWLKPFAYIVTYTLLFLLFLHTDARSILNLLLLLLYISLYGPL